MSVNLTQRLGLPAEFNYATHEFTYPSWATVKGEFWEKSIADNGRPGIWRSLMFASSYKKFDGSDDVKPDFKKLGLEGRAYFGFRDYRMTCPKEGKFGEKVRPDVTVIPARMFGREFARTEGHTHLSGLPEIYETISGKVGYLLFKPLKHAPSRIGDAMLVVSEPGDHILFPPGYAHITINLDRTQPAIVTDLVSSEANPSFEEIRRRAGGSHHIVSNGQDPALRVQKNPQFDDVPELRIVKPAEELILPTGKLLRKGDPMFNIYAEGRVGPFMFLNDPEQWGYQAMYDKAFVPFS